eukprot:CAMPEP_0184496562 /NCGR_PEP_ID=MMETSP0113_2-20130426/34259_1 /TAXON_ID=91329 /ORGANISM="Norrisiella sphaerica, Strain BC52" /LENGTH=182 /DNA_ID=CAMNT_0026883237 /DNA_START=89 /DNA_END=638 /DNA_ORIENTATION=+
MIVLGCAAMRNVIVCVFVRSSDEVVEFHTPRADMHWQSWIVPTCQTPTTAIPLGDFLHSVAGRAPSPHLQGKTLEGAFVALLRTLLQDGQYTSDTPSSPLSRLGFGNSFPCVGGATHFDSFDNFLSMGQRQPVDERIDFPHPEHTLFSIPSIERGPPRTLEAAFDLGFVNGPFVGPFDGREI